MHKGSAAYSARLSAAEKQGCLPIRILGECAAIFKRIKTERQRSRIGFIPFVHCLADAGILNKPGVQHFGFYLVLAVLHTSRCRGDVLHFRSLCLSLEVYASVFYDRDRADESRVLTEKSRMRVSLFIRLVVQRCRTAFQLKIWKEILKPRGSRKQE